MILIPPKMTARNAKRWRSIFVKVLETKKVYVDMSTITSSYLNSLFSLISLGATFYLFISFYFCFVFTYCSFADFIGDNYSIEVMNI